jgi:hypothetical protein
VEIEDDDIRLLPPDHLERLGATRGGDHAPVSGEEERLHLLNMGTSSTTRMVRFDSTVPSRRRRGD